MGDLGDIFGGKDSSDFFSRIFGGMQDASSNRTSRRPSHTHSYEQEVEISLVDAFQGATGRGEIDGRRLEVKIPAGAQTGTRIRVAHAISTGAGDLKADLYLLVKVRDDPRFERQGHNLYVDVTLDLYTAVLGGEVTVPTLSGNVVLTVPAGTQPGQTFRLKGRGMPHLKNPERQGDLRHGPG